MMEDGEFLLLRKESFSHKEAVVEVNRLMTINKARGSGMQLEVHCT